MSGEGASQSNLFSAKTLIWIIAAGVIGFAAFLILSTYAPDYRPLGRSPANVQSVAGNGFAGLKRWVEANEYLTRVVRDREDLYTEGLVIVTLEISTPHDKITEMARQRDGKPTLYILPKYFVEPMKNKAGWVEKQGVISVYNLQSMLNTLTSGMGEPNLNMMESGDLTNGLTMYGREIPTKTRWRRTENVEGVVHDKSGTVVLAELPESQAYILVDPDLMNNAGLANPQVAKAAIDAIRKIAPEEEMITFDTSAHFAGKQKYSLMKLVLEPPFLALTLTIIFAAILAVLNGLGRFGPPRVPQRVFAFGKRSLVDMTALLMRRGNKLGGLAPRYAALVRGRAGEALGAPQNMSAEALDQWLEDTDRAADGDWRNLVAEAGQVHGPQPVKSVAKKLYDWKARRISER